MGNLGNVHCTGPQHKCAIDTTSSSHAYAICTPSGSIYTVDDEDSTADCMLVENGKILAIGNAGMHSFHPFSMHSLVNLANSEHIREYWNTYNPNVPLEMLQTPPGSIIIPGLAGKALSICRPPTT